MTTSAERLDGDALDPRIARVLIFHRERIAQLTEDTIRKLRRLGVKDDDLMAVVRRLEQAVEDPA